METKENENRFYEFAKKCDAIIFARLAPNQKAQVSDSARELMQKKMIAIGDGVNDTPMLQRADLGIRLIPKGAKKLPNLTRSADFVLENFRQLDSLIFKFGFQSYSKISKLTCYYFYKNMILVFAEVWFAGYCGFSNQHYFIKVLITLYNAVLTTFQAFIGLYYDQTTEALEEDNTDVEVYFYIEGITN